jgi:hypothetical protein
MTEKPTGDPPCTNFCSMEKSSQDTPSTMARLYIFASEKSIALSLPGHRPTPIGSELRMALSLKKSFR